MADVGYRQLGRRQGAIPTQPSSSIIRRLGPGHVVSFVDLAIFFSSPEGSWASRWVRLAMVEWTGHVMGDELHGALSQE